jgi:hypothetical protein
MRTIYCDEAGFTGNRLLDEDQPYFAFAGIKIDPNDADEYVQNLLASSGLKTGELKGKNLCKRPRGQRIVQKVIEDLAPQVQVSFSNKTYALCAKMFEYLMEPALSPVSSLLYELKFHRFVANMLYCFLVAEKTTWECVYRRFEEALRGRTEQQLTAIGHDSIRPICTDNFPDDVVTFLMCNRAKIAEEVVIDKPQRAGGWLLELSLTALRSILCAFGEDMHPIEVFCDNSIPLVDQVGYLDAMIVRTEQVKIRFAGEEHSFIFNLARPIELVDSAAYPGIQLADLFASASVFALRNPDHELAECWFQYSEKFVQPQSMVPQPEYADLSRPDVFVNALIFRRLVDLSVRGEGYLGQLPEIIMIAQEAVRSDPEKFATIESSS